MNKNIYFSGAVHNDNSRHVDITVRSAEGLGSLLRDFFNKDEAENVPFEEVGGKHPESSQSACENEYGFNRNAILAMVTDPDKELIADILIENMGNYVGKQKPKAALLPFYCALYEINWIAQRPEYNDFVVAFPNLINSATSYSSYIPKSKQESKYHSCKDIDIVAMSEALQAALQSKKTPIAL